MTFEQTPCDICGKAILPTDRVSRTDDEVAHVSCVSAWFRGNFGREVLS